MLEGMIRPPAQTELHVCHYRLLFNPFFTWKLVKGHRQTVQTQIRSELQTRGAIDNKDNFSYFSMKAYVVTPHLNCLDEKVLIMDHKICFNGKLWLIISKLSLLPLLIWMPDMWCLIRVYIVCSQDFPSKIE